MSRNVNLVFVAVSLFLVLAVLFSYPDNGLNDSNVISGFVVHPLYTGYALPYAYSASSVNTFLQFSSATNNISKSFDVSDSIVYRRAFVSYDGQQWTPFILTTTNIVSGDWIYTKGTATVSFTPAQLRMSLSRNATNNTYVVIYSCSRINNVWDCHNGWQIIKFDAKITTLTTPTPTPNPDSTLTDLNICLSSGYNCGNKTISGVSKNCGTCVASLTCNSNNLCVSATGKTYYVAASGSDSTGNGSINNPFFTLNKAWSTATVNDMIYMRGGTYRYGQTDSRLWDKSGTVNNMIEVWAYPGERPIINYSDIAPTKELYALDIANTKYLHLKGIRVTQLAQPRVGNLAEYGLRVNENTQNCIFEQIETDHIGGWGVVIGQNGENSNNLFLNCDSHHNADPYSTNGEPYGWSDGFETASHGSTNNTFRGCRAWSNSDDGWDLLRSDGLYIIENCWSFWNGYKEDGVTPGGNGEGYKLLGPDTVGTTETRKIIRNSLAFENTNVGIAGNPGVAETNPQGIQMINNIAYHNGNGGIGIVWQNTKGLVRNTISYDNTGYDNTIRNYDFNGADVTHDHNSFDSSVTVSDSDFLSVDSRGMDGPRQADGSLPKLKFLHLNSTSDLIGKGVNVGLTTDGDGKPWKINPSIGAFEYYP